MRDQLLPFVGSEIIDALVYPMRQNQGTLRLGEKVRAVEPFDNATGRRVRVRLTSGKAIVTDKLLYSMWRTAATDTHNLDSAGVAAGERGRLDVNAHYQTSVPHIYAVGDVIGFPSLASTSMEQGRLAACHAFGADAQHMPEYFPYGIYTIPEISLIGKNEQELTGEGVPYETG